MRFEGVMTLRTLESKLICDTDSRISRHVLYIQMHNLPPPSPPLMTDMNKATIGK